MDPHPLSITASGGKMMQRITRQIDIAFVLNFPKLLKCIYMTKCLISGYNEDRNYNGKQKGFQIPLLY